MKIFLCVVLLFGLDISQASEDDWFGNEHIYGVNNGREYHPRPYYYNHDHRRDHNSDYIRNDHYAEHIYDDYSRDDHYYDHITRPCSTHDVDCIRRFLAHYFGCSHTEHGSDSAIIKELTMDVPHSNVTITINNARLGGLDTGRIEEFHIDKKTDTLVFQVAFDHFIVDSPLTTITYYRKGKAPVEASDNTYIDFRHISYTWTIRHLHDAHRAVSHVSAYIGDQTIPFKSGPGLHSNGLAWVNKIWLHRMPLTVTEAMVKQASAYFEAFMQAKICKLPEHVLSSA